MVPEFMPMQTNLINNLLESNKSRNNKVSTAYLSKNKIRRFGINCISFFFTPQAMLTLFCARMLFMRFASSERGENTP